MNETSALQSSISGIKSGMNRVANDAQSILRSTTEKDGDRDLTKPLVDLISDRNQVQASAKSAKIADGTIGTLLDVMA